MLRNSDHGNGGAEEFDTPRQDPSRDGSHELSSIPRALVPVDLSDQVVHPLGERVIAHEPTVQKWCRNIEKALSKLTGEDEGATLRPLWSRFAAFVVDLPASDTDHHRESWGLLTHSLETMWLSLDLLQLQGVSKVPPSDPSRGEHLLSLRGAMAAALLHDCGKILDVKIQSLDRLNRWDCERESLAAFRERHGSSPWAAASLSFRRGRTLKGHEKRGRWILPTFIPECFSLDLMWATFSAYDAYILTPSIDKKSPGIPLWTIGNTISDADRGSVYIYSEDPDRPNRYRAIIGDSE